MKIKYILLNVLLLASISACSLSDFEENYRDPSKLSQTTVGKQFSGMIFSNREYVLPSYWNYFVVHRITSNRFNQTVGWVNTENQYVPGGAAINDRWNRYYAFLAQYREIEKVYNSSSEVEKQDNRIYMIAAATYFYDHTQQVVDLHGDIPWSKAGLLSINGGDYTKSYAGYDKATDIYTKMLNDLKAFADELNSITVKNAIQVEFKTQDLINRGDIQLWKVYVNSLRLRMLTRVSGSSAFSARADQEIGAILSNPSTYPIATTNAMNISWKIHSLGTLLSPTSFQSGLEDWNGNIAGKAIVDHMKNNQDPRLPFVFEPGLEAKGEYMGLDPMMNASQQTQLVGSNTLTIYNRSTISRNQFFPGVIFTAAEAHLLAAEYFLKKNQLSTAKTHYEEAIRQSLSFYQFLRSISNNGIVPAPVPPTGQDVSNYLAKSAISWDAAATAVGRLRLIADQKWLHFNVIQPNENWAELRRIGLVQLTFWTDDSNQQKQPPFRWIYPGSEQTYNRENYAVVQGNDNLTTRLFWDPS